ncbi:RNA-directed DNA polymerase, partial [Brachionus plicatilis]
PKDRFKHRVNYVTEETEEQGNDIGYVFSVSDDNRALPVITIDIGDNKVKTEVLIDTGSSLNIIDKQTYKRLKPKPVLEVVKGKVFGFQNSCPLVFAGEFRTLIGHKDKLVEAKIAVVNGTERCLLGYKTASDLGIVKILNHVKVDSDSSSCKQDLEYFKAKYPNKLKVRQNGYYQPC